MTSVLVVNAGSSSLKLRVLDSADEVIASADLSPWDGSPDGPGLRDFQAVDPHRELAGCREFPG
jgi:acetate kinase